MRSYKKLKLYSGGALSKNNKGILAIHRSNAVITTTATIFCNVLNTDGTSTNLNLTLFPVLDGSGVIYNPPTNNSWGILPFNVVSVAGNTGSMNIYELF